VTNKPLQFEELEVWDISGAFSPPHPSHECLYDNNAVEVQLSFQTREVLYNMN